MNDTKWQQYFVSTADLELAVFEVGAGPIVILLSGGPGDDHRYLRPVAEQLASNFRCILYDQRGCGESRVKSYNEETLHLDRFMSDLEAIRTHLGAEKVRLMGHSWGGNLALYYAIFHSEHLAAASLVGAGPINAELEAAYSANFNQALSPAEKLELAKIRVERDAIRDGDNYNFEAYRDLHVRGFEISTCRSFYSPEIAAEFVKKFRALYNFNPLVPKYLRPSTRQLEIGPRLKEIKGRLQVIYGYQDIMPATQAYVVREAVPQTQICLINECGHVPWAEQPEIFYRELIEFLKEE